MNKNSFRSFFAVILLAGIVASCSTDAVTDAMQTGFSELSIGMKEPTPGEFIVSGKWKVILTNRTERVMNVVFREGTISDAETGEALVRFRPIVPDSYGATSTVQLFSKQTQEFDVVTPLDLSGFDPAKHPSVVVSMKYNTEGYRTESTSGPATVQTIK